MDDVGQHPTFFAQSDNSCCILSQFRGSFNVSIGFGLGLLRRQGVLAWYVPPCRVVAWLAYPILSAGLVPVNDLGTQAYECRCRVGGMVSRFFVTISTH